MARPKIARTKEEIEAIPADKPVTIETLVEDPPMVEGKTDDTVKTDQIAKEPPKRAAEPPVKDPEIEALKKQLEDLQRLNTTSRADLEAQRQEALRQQQTLRTQLDAQKDEAEQYQYDAILNAINAASAESEAAQRDLMAAISENDPVKQAAAQSKIARAEAKLDRLEGGKEEFEARRQSNPQKEKPSQISTDPFETSIQALPDEAKNWLRGHRDYMTDPRKNARIQALHWDVLDAGHKAFSKEYFDDLEVKLGMREAPKVVKKEDEDDEIDGAVVSAPVSREAVSPSTGKTISTRVTLSAAEREAAKLAGIDEITYAKQKLKLAQMKEEGHYN